MSDRQELEITGGTMGQARCSLCEVVGGSKVELEGDWSANSFVCSQCSADRENKPFYCHESDATDAIVVFSPTDYPIAECVYWDAESKEQSERAAKLIVDALNAYKPE